MPQYIVRKVKIGKTSQLDELARPAGELYSRTIVSFWRTVRKKDVSLSGYSMEKWHMSDKLHAHTSDAVTQSFYASLKSWRSRRKTAPNSKPTIYHRCRWFGLDNVNGSNNIRAKYLGEVPVVGLMVRPSGIRWYPHIQCNSTTLRVEESPELLERRSDAIHGE